MSEIEDLVIKAARTVTTYTDVQWNHLRPAQRTYWLSLARDTLYAAGVPELLAERGKMREALGPLLNVSPVDPEGNYPGTPSYLAWLRRVERDDLRAELAEWHSECDKVGIPYDPSGLVRHHRNNAGAASENWKAVATERGNKLDSANAALARFEELADRMERESPKPGPGGFLAEILRDIINPKKWND